MKPYTRFDNNSIQDKMMLSTLPYSLRRHPLMIRLGLNEIEQCWISPDKQFIKLIQNECTIQLSYIEGVLTISKEWVVMGKKNNYTLTPLSDRHPGYTKEHAETKASVPKYLKEDPHIDCWQSVTNSQDVLLTIDNRPAYLTEHGKFRVIHQSGAYLTSDQTDWHPEITHFENDAFTLTHTLESGDMTTIHLPRLNLDFEVNSLNKDNTLILKQTGEEVRKVPSPIDDRVAGIMLTKGENSRFMVRIAPFYATPYSGVISDFYPITHDIEGTIKNKALDDYWDTTSRKNKPQFYYRGSEPHASYLMKDGVPIADKVSDALYLAYMYLATNQPEKAWPTLQDAKTRLGGLTGDPDELRYIAWICNDLPHILDKNLKDKAKIKTPAVVACQSKALGLLCDFLTQDRSFKFKEPKRLETANDELAHIEVKDQREFLNKLPDTVYNLFCRLQRCRRHLEHHYDLSSDERLTLLSYYHQTQKSDYPKGALGHEWMTLHLELIKKEFDELNARIELNTATKSEIKRAALLKKKFDTLPIILGSKSDLQYKKIDLSIPVDAKIKCSYSDNAHYYLSKYEDYDIEFKHIELSPETLNPAIEALNSSMTLETMLKHLPVYLKLTFSEETQHDSAKKQLDHFVKTTLISNRHILQEKELNSLPLLCNILYRLLNNKINPNDIGKLESLFKIARKCTEVPVLTIPELVNNFEETLLRPEDLWNKPKPTQKPIQTNTLEKSALFELLELEKTGIGAIIKNYNQSIQEISKKNEKNLDEVIAGKQLFEIEAQKKRLADKILKDPQSIDTLVTLTEKSLPDLEQNATTLWNDALKLANQGPNDKDKALAWAIEMESQARGRQTKSNLIALFCHAECTLYAEETGLDEEHCRELHDKIQKAMVAEIQHQMLQRVKAGFESKNTAKIVEALDTLAKEKIPGIDNPVALIIQHQEEIILRDRQVDALESLLDQSGPNKDKVEKITPGGGKSKVILPVFAEKMARGDNLVIIEVPPSLLSTNHVDLNRTSQRLFGKQAIRFEFNRDSKCTPERLRQIYEMLTHTMVAKNYLVTTGDSIQSLELKYLELLLSDTIDSTQDQQIIECEKICELLKHHTDGIVDEAHQGFWIKKKLNYTFGTPSQLDKKLIQYEVDLFRCIEPEVIREAPSLPKDHYWLTFKTKLAEKVMGDQGPLYFFVKKARSQFDQNELEHLRRYLIEPQCSLPECVANASPEEQNTLAFFKQQISILMVETMTRKLGHYYGTSKEKSLDAIKYTLAIPYSGNNHAEEQSRFHNPLETMNLSAQMMFIHGISKELFYTKVKEWLLVARQELIKNPELKSLDQTPTGLAFIDFQKHKPVKLSKIRIDNQEMMDEVFVSVQFSSDLMLQVLEEQTLALIPKDAKVLHSDSINHADMYRSVQAISGTPRNHSTFHQRFHFDATTSLGSDDYIVEQLISKNTQLIALDYKDIKSYIEQVFKKSQKPELVRALIDINATFNGIPNLEVARIIAAYIRQHHDQFSKPIKYVLFFNDEQVLCALDVNNPQNIITLGSSDVNDLNRILQCRPEERFTYYDQSHTLGTDIKQFPEARALVFIDEKTPFQAFIQGNMRMRELSQDQGLDIFIPTHMKDTDLKQLVEFSKKTEEESLQLDTFFATQAKMINCIRSECLAQIRDLPSDQIAKKRELAKQFEIFLLSSPEDDLFKMYGTPKQVADTDKILKNYQKHLMALWAQCYTQVNEQAPEKVQLKLNSQMTDIIEKSLPFCAKEYQTPDSSFGEQVQIQKQVMVQVQQQQQQMLNEYYDDKLNAEDQKKWYIDYGSSFPSNVRSINDIFDKSIFANNLKVSDNYTKTYQKQNKFTDCYLKPVFLVWYHLDESNKLTATIITPQELDIAKELLDEIQKKGKSQNWIATTQNNVVWGTPKEELYQTEEYLSLREQVKFFNGEFGSLLQQNEPLYWLNTKSHEKMEFYKKSLQLYRHDNASDLRGMEAALGTKDEAGYDYLRNHLYEDMEAIDWPSLFPYVLTSQLTNYDKTAHAIVDLHKTWLTAEPTELGSKLSASGKRVLKEHQQDLDEIKKIFEIIKAPSDKTLSTEQLNTLNQFLRTTLSSIYDKDLKDLAHIKILQAFLSHPAFKYQQKAVFDSLQDYAKQTKDASVFKQILESQLPQSLLGIILEDVLSDSQYSTLLLRQKELDKDSIITLLKRESFSESDLINLLKRDTIDLSVIKEIKENQWSLNLVEAIIKHAKKQRDPELIKSITAYLLKEHPENKEKTERLISDMEVCFESLQSSDISTLFEHCNLSAKLTANLFKRFPEAMEKPFSKTIADAKHGDLSLLLNKQETGTLPESLFLNLINCCGSEDEILQLLDRDDHTENTLTALISRLDMKHKDQMNCYIQKYPRSLTTQVQRKILEIFGSELLGYLNLEDLMTHANTAQFGLILDLDSVPYLTSTQLKLFDKEANLCLRNLHKDIAELKKKATKSKDPLDELTLHLEQFRLKAYTNAIKARHYANYRDAATTSLKLYHSVAKDLELYKTGKIDKKVFKDNTDVV